MSQHSTVGAFYLCDIKRLDSLVSLDRQRPGHLSDCHQAIGQADDGPALTAGAPSLRANKRLDSLISLDKQADDDPALNDRGTASFH